MMTETTLANATLVLRDGTVTGAVRLRDGVIHDIGTAADEARPMGAGRFMPAGSE